MYRVLRSVLLSVAEAAKKTYPNEFIAMLGGERDEKLIDEFVAVPAEFGRNFSLVRTHLIPFDSRIMGSIHSHPSPNYRPSRADLRSFAKLGEIHFIIAYPFTIDSIAVYDVKGNELEVEVIDDA